MENVAHLIRGATLLGAAAVFSIALMFVVSIVRQSLESTNGNVTHAAIFLVAVFVVFWMFLSG